MNRIFVFLYGIASYGVFFISFLYAIGFVGNFIVPKSVDSGTSGGVIQAFMINFTLLGIFAVQHTVMARPGFKRWWTKIIPEQIERSTFVLISSLLLLLLYWLWQPIHTVVWDIQSPFGALLMKGFFWLGWMIVFLSTFMINHFDLFGLRQVYLHLKDIKYQHVGFMTSYLYRFTRHPIMLGFIIAFWFTPYMTVGHLLFAGATTMYILVGIQFEERDLKNFLGKKYEHYQECVPMLIPFGKKLKNDKDNTCEAYHLFETDN